MIETLIIVEHEEIFVSSKRDIDKKIISYKDKKELFSIIHTDRFNQKKYVFSRKGSDGIKANSIVGSISLKSGLIIEILPKFAKDDLTDETIIKYRKNLLRMIQVSNEKNFISSTLQSSKISVGEMPLIRYMIELFSESLLHSLRNSVVTTYNRTVENSSCVRGNILLTKTLQNNIVDKSKVYISYNKHSSNNLLMQIFKTLSQLLLNDTNLSYRAKQYLYEVYILLDSVSTISLKQHHFEKVVFNRLNDKYETLFKQAEFIFNQYMPFTSNINSTPFWAILFNMDYLFEKFCAYLLRRSQIEVLEQEKIPAFNNNNSLVSAKPDFIIKEQVDLFHQKSTNVLDAKWKLLDSEKKLYGLNAQNFWQLFSYMNLIENEEINGYFIVPKNSDDFDDEVVFEPIRQGRKSITILSIDFSLEFDEILERYQFKLENGCLKIDLQKKDDLVVEEKKESILSSIIEKEEFQFNLEEFIKELETLHSNKNIRKKLSPNKKDERFKNLYYLKEAYNANSSAFKIAIKENLLKSSWDFTGLGIKLIPSNIIKLKNILFLTLANNKLYNLPIEICRLKKLIVLDISNNYLKILPPELIGLKSLKKLIIDKEMVENNIVIIKELKEKDIKVKYPEGNNLFQEVVFIEEDEEYKETELKPIEFIEPIKKILSITTGNYPQLTKEEKQNFIDESDFSLISKDIIELIMKENDIDILEDFTYNQTLPLAFGFAIYNNNIKRASSEVNRLKENLLRRKNKTLTWILSWTIKLQENYIQNNINKIEKDILLGYAMSSLSSFRKIRELISEGSIILDVLNELSKNKDDEKVLLNIMFKNREYKKFQNTDTIYSTVILDRIAHYHQYYIFEDKFCLITKLARNYSLPNKTKEYLFEKYKTDKIFLEELGQNNCEWELENKITEKLAQFGLNTIEKESKHFENFNSINFESTKFKKE
jgi:5-methylcytosine-specific restriction enzyme subunit McrC